jgi:hypothetical protein
MSRNPAEKQAWIEEAAQAADDECREWPWGRNHAGYGRLKVSGKTRGTHSIVCAMVNGPRPDGMQAAHSCGRPACCNGTHLRWDTLEGNQADRVGHGTSNRGERNGRAKLSIGQVKEIRFRYAAGGQTHRGLASEYGVSHLVIGQILRGQLWAHVT